MSDGRFGIAAPYHRDPGAELQQWHRERQQNEERADRAARWLADKLTGLTFHSFEALEAAAVRVFEVMMARPCSADERHILSNAARACWCGIALRARTALEINETGHVASLTFHRAA